MLRRLLRSTARFVLAHPYRVVLLTALPCLLLGSFIPSTPLDLSLTGVMDRSNPEVARYFDLSRKYRLGGTLILLLEGEDAALDAASLLLERRLVEHPAVRSVTPPLPAEWIAQQSPWLVDRETFDLWVRQVREPANAENGRELAERFEELAKVRDRLRPSGARLLDVRMESDPFDEEMGKSSFNSVKEKVEALLGSLPESQAGDSGGGVEVSFSGMPAVAAQDQERTLGTIRRLSPLSLLLVLVIFRVVERRWIGMFAVMVALLFAVAATLGAIGLLMGRLTVMETFFGVTIFGLGIDFAVHLLVRQREERARGLSFADALEATLAGTGRGVIAGALTTAGAFFIVSLAPDPVARHLGLSGGLGLLLCLVLMLTLLPASWVLLEWRRQANPKGAQPAVSAVPVPGLSSIARHAVLHPRLHLVVAGVLVVVSLVGVPRFHMETRVDRVFNRNVPAVKTVERVRQLFQLNGAPWIVAAQSLEEVSALATRFREHPAFATVSSVADFVPGAAEASERTRILEELEPALARATSFGQSLLAQPLLASAQRELVRGLVSSIEVLDRARENGAPTLQDLPPGLSERFVGPNGDLLVFAYVAGSTFDARQAQSDRLAAQSIDPSATGLTATLEAILIGRRPWLAPVAFGILGFVVLVLYVDFRNWRWSALALVPVVVGVAITIGVLCWLDVAFNVMTMIVLPLIVGLGVDDGIHVVHRLIEDIDQPIETATTAVGRAIVMTTATTCSSFAILLLTDHAGLETMAMVMLIGLPICLLASVTTLPALATFWLRPR